MVYKKKSTKKAAPKVKEFKKCVTHMDKDGEITDRPNCVICATNRELAAGA